MTSKHNAMKREQIGESLAGLYFKSPAKLHFKYTAMNGGKSTALLQIAHNYSTNNKQHILIAKPKTDTKGDDCISSRISEKLSVRCDFLIDSENSIIKQVFPHMLKIAEEKNEHISALLVDEAQFLNKKDIEELAYISNIIGIPVICFGLRTDYLGNIFEGSAWLFAYAQDVEELPTRPMSARGDKDKKATMNLRLKNGEPSFTGEQVIIDGQDNITYEPVTLSAFIRERHATGELRDFGRFTQAMSLYEFADDIVEEASSLKQRAYDFLDWINGYNHTLEVYDCMLKPKNREEEINEGSVYIYWGEDAILKLLRSDRWDTDLVSFKALKQKIHEPEEKVIYYVDKELRDEILKELENNEKS